MRLANIVISEREGLIIVIYCTLSEPYPYMEEDSAMYRATATTSDYYAANN